MTTTNARNADTAQLVPDTANGASPYAENWSLHPGEALRRKRGLTAKEQ